MKRSRQLSRSVSTKREITCLWQRRNGIVKKTPITDYANVRKTGLAAINLRDDDELIEVKKTDNNKDIILSYQIRTVYPVP